MTDFRPLPIKIDPESLYDEKTAAVAIGGETKPIPASTMRFWRHAGTGPEFFKMGHHVRYRGQALIDFMESGKRQSTAA